jgi:hypothetical protein
MLFSIFGPFEMPRGKNGLVSKDAGEKRAFWSVIDEECDGLSFACGCYVFAVSRSGGEAKPWYVGMSCKQSFRVECFQPHKIMLYNEPIYHWDRAMPLLFLIAKLTPGERFAIPSVNGHKDIKELEDVLIGIAYAANRELLNMRGTRFLREAVVPGVMNTPPGYPGHAASALKSLLGL